MKSEALRPKPRLSVIVPSFRRFSPLLDTIHGLINLQDVDFGILVVDQNPLGPNRCEVEKRSWPATRTGLSG
jgi:hypothetical protein